MNNYTKYVLIIILFVFAMFIITHCLTKLRVIEGLEQSPDYITETKTLPETVTETETLPETDTSTEIKQTPTDTPVIAQSASLKDVQKPTTVTAAPYVTTTVSVAPPSLQNTQPIGQSIQNTPQPNKQSVLNTPQHIKQPAQNAVNSKLLNAATNKTPGKPPPITKSPVKTKNF